MPVCCNCERTVSDEVGSIDWDVYYGWTCWNYPNCEAFVCKLCEQNTDVGRLLFDEEDLEDYGWICKKCNEISD